NLANATTTGFKSELDAFGSLPVQGPGSPTRINAVAQSLGRDDSQGALQQTGRALDVAVRGSGWIAVQAPDGSEAYTRAGNLQLTADGTLTDAAGNPVLGNGGPISIPDSAQIVIGNDGTISSVPLGQGPNTLTQIDRIKLVNPEPAQLAKGADGLLHLPGVAGAGSQQRQSLDRAGADDRVVAPVRDAGALDQDRRRQRRRQPQAAAGELNTTPLAEPSHVLLPLDRQDRPRRAADAPRRHLQQPGQRQHHRLQGLAPGVPGPDVPEPGPARRADHRADAVAL